jgi:plasmid stabilization system protein ParE
VIELRVSEAAALTIVEQADYYREHSDEDLAARWEQAVGEGFHSLLEMPQRGAPCRFRAPGLSGLRWILVPGFEKHLIFYRYSPEEKVLLIAHVLYGARELESILTDENA